MKAISGQLIERLVLNFWWVLLFILLCTIFYEQGMKTQKRDYNELFKKYQHLKEVKKKEIQRNIHLQMQINSQSDPSWVELTLMRRLGLVPEGQRKIFFKE